MALLASLAGASRGQPPAGPGTAAPGGEPILAAREALARQDARAAIGLLRPVAAARPADAVVATLLGEAHLLAEHPAEALLHFERARAAGASEAAIQLRIGTALWQLNRLQEAEGAFRRSWEAGGGVTAIQQLGRLLLWMGRQEEASTHLELAARARPGDADLALDAADALAAAGRLPQAIGRYRELAVREPERPAVRYRLARALLLSGDRAGGERELAAYRVLIEHELVRAHREGLARATLDQAWDLYRRDLPADALALFVTLPESVEGLCGIAFSRSALGDHAGAVLALERAVALAPDRQDLRLALAEERLAEGGT